MSAIIQLVFFLTGALAGRTIKLGKYSFVEGKLTLSGPAEELALHRRSLERNWSAYPEGDPRLKENNDGSGDVSTEGARGPGPAGDDGNGGPDGASAPSGETPDVGSGDAPAETGEAERPAGGDGSPPVVTEPEAEGDARLKRAIAALDPEDDSHWIASGLPAMVAVERIYGSAGITRADVEAAAPGYNREAARAARSS